jgi:hypothetical protein
MMGETKSGAQRPRLYGLGASGPQGPGSAPYSALLHSHEVHTMSDGIITLEPYAWVAYFPSSHTNADFCTKETIPTMFSISNC